MKAQEIIHWLKNPQESSQKYYFAVNYAEEIIKTYGETFEGEKKKIMTILDAISSRIDNAPSPVYFIEINKDEFCKSSGVPVELFDVFESYFCARLGYHRILDEEIFKILRVTPILGRYYYIKNGHKPVYKPEPIVVCKGFELYSPWDYNISWVKED